MKSRPFPWPALHLPKAVNAQLPSPRRRSKKPSRPSSRASKRRAKATTGTRKTKASTSLTPWQAQLCLRPRRTPTAETEGGRGCDRRSPALRRRPSSRGTFAPAASRATASWYHHRPPSSSASASPKANMLASVLSAQYRCRICGRPYHKECVDDGGGHAFGTRAPTRPTLIGAYQPLLTEENCTPQAHSTHASNARRTSSNTRDESLTRRGRSDPL